MLPSTLLLWAGDFLKESVHVCVHSELHIEFIAQHCSECNFKSTVAISYLNTIRRYAVDSSKSSSPYFLAVGRLLGLTWCVSWHRQDAETTTKPQMQCKE